jgi:hypothetical protein
MSARLDAVALVTAVHGGDGRAIDMVLDDSDLRDLAVVLAQIVCTVVDHAHRDHDCPHSLTDRVRYAGLHWARREATR